MHGAHQSGHANSPHPTHDCNRFQRAWPQSTTPWCNMFSNMHCSNLARAQSHDKLFKLATHCSQPWDVRRCWLMAPRTRRPTGGASMMLGSLHTAGNLGRLSATTDGHTAMDGSTGGTIIRNKGYELIFLILCYQKLLK